MSHINLSTYQYCSRYPISFIDPTGMDEIYIDENGKELTRRKVDGDHSYITRRANDNYKFGWEYYQINSAEAAYLMSSGVRSEIGNIAFNRNEMLVQWDGNRGFWGNLSGSKDVVEQLGYGISNDFYLTLQAFDFNNFGKDYTNPFNGSRAYTNLDGTPQYDVNERGLSVATTIAPFLDKVKFSKPLTIVTKNAGQYNSLFKGTLVTTMTSEMRGNIYKSLNWGVKRVNSMLSWANDPFNWIDMGQAVQEAKENK